jgi:uroporphyrinogen-III synthase
MSDVDLAGTRVLVTRPGHQAERLIAAIEAANGVAVAFPVIEIVPRDRVDVQTDADRLPEADITVFVSANAVAHGLEFAGTAPLAAVGPATAAAIVAAGRDVGIRPARGFDSESLLAEPAMNDVEGKAVRIVRGVGGRELLGNTLASRGATVDYLEVYVRRIPDLPESRVDALAQEIAEGKIDVVTVMSVQSLDNLLKLLPGGLETALAETPLVTPATRVIKEVMNRLPGCPATLAAGPGADEMVRAIAMLGLQSSGHHS